jgi:hypothetical protein
VQYRASLVLWSEDNVIEGSLEVTGRINCIIASI